jgi:hypothetical protein
MQIIPWKIIQVVRLRNLIEQHIYGMYILFYRFMNLIQILIADEENVLLVKKLVVKR